MKTGSLKTPYLGYTTIELIKKIGYKWWVRIVGPGTEILVYEDEFILD